MYPASMLGRQEASPESAARPMTTVLSARTTTVARRPRACTDVHSRHCLGHSSGKLRALDINSRRARLGLTLAIAGRGWLCMGKHTTIQDTSATCKPLEHRTWGHQGSDSPWRRSCAHRHEAHTSVTVYTSL